ncbi:MAG: L-2-hydroxyglutarate oxidase, partial [Myxococcota bacterium]
VVATSEDQLPALGILEQRGRANGLEGLKRLKPEELSEIEPHVRAVAALHVQETGIVDYRGVCQAYARVCRQRGVEIRTGCRMFGFWPDDQTSVVETERGALRCRLLVNCAGLYADRIARMCGVEPDVQIVPFRGEYYDLRPEAEHLVRGLIYPVPDARFPFLGVHLTKMVHGGVEAGPNAVLAFAREGYRKRDVSLTDMIETLGYPGFWRLSLRHVRRGIGELMRSFSKRLFLRSLQHLVPALESQDITPGGAGVRAQALTREGHLVDDFRIEQRPGMLHVLNAPSPAATASISIGQTLAEQAQRMLSE